jgi:hypothetical protein
MTPEQILAIRCAYADLVGALQHHENDSTINHDWDAHEQSIEDLLSTFPELNLDN